MGDFVQITNSVGRELDSLKKTLEYLQDLLNVYGLKIWYDEYNKLIISYAEIELNYKKTGELPDEAMIGWNPESKDFMLEDGE